MEQYLGLRPTPRRIDDPVGAVVELVDAADDLYTALVFDRAPPRRISLNVELVISFLEYPMVMGLAELVHHDVAKGWFVYSTGPSWTLGELLTQHATAARAMGPRASLELIAIVSDILADAAQIGAEQGCFSHGQLTPGRITVGHDGQVQVIGHGIPLTRDRVLGDEVTPHAIRYAPPERLFDTTEDVRADVYALSAIAFEVATGKPLFSGDAAAMRERIAAGDGGRSLRGAGLPRTLVHLLASGLEPNPEERPPPTAFGEQARALLQGGKLPGSSLDSIVQTHGGRGSVRRAPLRTRAATPRPSPDTGALPFATIAAAPRPAVPVVEPEPEPEIEATPAPQTPRARWEQVTAPPSPAPEPEPEPEPIGPRRRRSLDPTVIDSRERRARRRRLPPADLPHPLPEDVQLEQPEPTMEEPVVQEPSAPEPVEEPEVGPAPEPADEPTAVDQPVVDEPAPETTDDSEAPPRPEPPPPVVDRALDEPTEIVSLPDDVVPASTEEVLAAVPMDEPVALPRPEVPAPTMPESRPLPRRRLSRSGSQPMTSRRRRRSEQADDDAS